MFSTSTLITLIHFLLKFHLAHAKPLSTVSDNIETLRLVQIVARHGFRAPEFSYPSDLYADEFKYWPNGFGELTELGKEEQFELGRFLARRYRNFLNSTKYHSKDVIALSSEYERTILSAQLTMSGIFTELSNSTLNFDSFIPVHSISKSVDMIIQAFSPCAKRQSIYNKEVKSNPEVLKFFKEKNTLLTNLQNGLGYDTFDLNHIMNSLLTLHIQKFYNLTLPSWTDEFFDPEIFKSLMQQVRFFTQTEELKRLTTGPMLNDLIKNMNGKLNGSESKKLIYYSGHDLTIAGILNTLDAFEGHWPDFSSCLIFELHQINNEDFIKILYKKSRYSNELIEIVSPYCTNIDSGRCSLRSFKDKLEKFLPINLQKECALDSEKPN